MELTEKYYKISELPKAFPNFPWPASYIGLNAWVRRYKKELNPTIIQQGAGRGRTRYFIPSTNIRLLVDKLKRNNPDIIKVTHCPTCGQKLPE